MTALRSRLASLSCLAAALLTLGAVMPSTWLWRCHQSQQLLAAPVAPSLTAMPCQPSAAMSCQNMPWCRGMLSHRALPHTSIMTAAPCRPDFLEIASLPDSDVQHPALSAWGAVARDTSLFAEDRQIAVSSPVLGAHRLRPPPPKSLPSISIASLPGFRAPPCSSLA